MLLNQDENTNSYVDFCNKYDINYLIWYSATNTIKKYGLELSKNNVQPGNQSNVSFTLEINMLNYIDEISVNNAKNIVLKIISNCNDIFIKKKNQNMILIPNYTHINLGYLQKLKNVVIL